MINDYLNIITSEYRQQPKYIAMLTAYLRKLQDAQLVIEAFDLHFALNEAIGIQLDKLGEIIGRSRILSFQPIDHSAMLDDNDYRLIIKAKILHNQWDGTIEDMAALFKQIFPGLVIEIIDNQNMSMEIRIVDLENNIQMQMLNNGYVIPKPEGVRIKVVFVTTLEQTKLILGAVTQAGSQINIYPSMSKKVSAQGQGYAAAYQKQATKMIIYPKEV